jgi:hypothetical protein
MAQHSGNGEARAGRGAGAAPTYPPPPPSGLSPVLERNIRALQLRRQRDEKEATVEERIAEAITRFIGSMDRVPAGGVGAAWRSSSPAGRCRGQAATAGSLTGSV